MVDDSPDQPVAHRHIHDMSPALDLIARMQLPVVAKQHDADFVFIDVECDAIHFTGKLQHLLKAHAGETRHLGDAGGQASDRPHLPWRQLRCEGFSHLAYSSKRAVEDVLQACQVRLAHWLFVSAASVRLEPRV